MRVLSLLVSSVLAQVPVATVYRSCVCPLSLTPNGSPSSDLVVVGTSGQSFPIIYSNTAIASIPAVQPVQISTSSIPDASNGAPILGGSSEVSTAAQDIKNPQVSTAYVIALANRFAVNVRTVADGLINLVFNFEFNLATNAIGGLVIDYANSAKLFIKPDQASSNQVGQGQDSGQGIGAIGTQGNPFPSTLSTSPLTGFFTSSRTPSAINAGSSQGSASTTSTTSASASNSPTTTNVFILSNGGQQFACANGALVLQPAGVPGSLVVLSNGVLMCGGQTVYVLPAATSMKRFVPRQIDTNSTSNIFSIQVSINGIIPGNAITFGFSINGNKLQLVVNGIQLSFAILNDNSHLIGYDPSKGIPPRASPIGVGATPASEATTSSGSSASPTKSGEVSISSTTSTSASSTPPSTTSISTTLASTTSSSTTSASPTVKISNSDAQTSSSSTTTGPSNVLSIVPSSTATTTTTSMTSSASLILSNSQSQTTASAVSSVMSSSSAPPSLETATGCSLGVTKPVFAHMIVGNTYNYGVADWTKDFTLASAKGINAMALNVGGDSWQPARIADAYAAAANLGSCFKVFMSFDMRNMAYLTSGDYLLQFITPYKSHPAQFYVNNQHFVSTFGGYQQFDWVATFKKPLLENHGISVNFVPSYSIDTNPQAAYAQPEVDGQFLWNAWPNDNGYPTAAYITPDLAITYGQEAQRTGKTFMLNISPWFSTHFANNNKNFVFRSEGLWFMSWQQTINQLRPYVNYLQITSWNDWGESHYLGPASPTVNTDYPQDAVANSLDWVKPPQYQPYASYVPVDGFVDHSAWLDEAVWWISYFQSGVAPAILPSSSKAYNYASNDYTTERFYASYRTTYKGDPSSEDPSRIPTGAADAVDAIVVTAYLSAPGYLYFYLGNSPAGYGNATSGDGSISLPAGQSMTVIPFMYTPVGGSPTRRDGNVEMSINRPDQGYAISFDGGIPIFTATQAAAAKYDFNAFVRKAPRIYAT